MKRQNILVPNNLSEITLGQYQRFARINEKEENEKVLERKMIEIFCSIDAENVKKIEYKSLKKIVVLLSDVINKKPELVKRFKIDKQEFGFIPKLDDMSFGEFVDLDTSLADWDTMHLAMGVLYRPIKNKLLDTYTVNEYKPEDEINMKEMPLDAALSAIFFLIDLGKELTNHIHNYSAPLIQEWTQQQKEHLPNNMAGTLQSML
jgi:hypothetical protein|tara:strand:+ start:3404 stop:4018 length:615 start_codon:yes stop_codon:yes gene_type:complete